MQKTILITIALTTLMLTSISNIAKAKEINFNTTFTPVSAMQSNMVQHYPSGKIVTVTPGFIKCMWEQEGELVDMYSGQSVSNHGLQQWVVTAVADCRAKNFLWKPSPRQSDSYTLIWMKNAVKYFPRYYNIKVSL